MWEASFWLVSPIVAEWWCLQPWSARVKQGLECAEESLQRKLLRCPLSESQMDCCIQTAPDHLCHSWQTSLQEKAAQGFWFKIRQTEGEAGNIDKRTEKDSVRQKAHKGFLILLAYTLFTSSCCPKVQIQTGEVEEKTENKVKVKQGVCCLRSIKCMKPPQNNIFKTWCGQHWMPCSLKLCKKEQSLNILTYEMVERFQVFCFSKGHRMLVLSPVTYRDDYDPRLYKIQDWSLMFIS